MQDVEQRKAAQPRAARREHGRHGLEDLDESRASISEHSRAALEAAMRPCARGSPKFAVGELPVERLGVLIEALRSVVRGPACCGSAQSCCRRWRIESLITPLAEGDGCLPGPLSDFLMVRSH